MCDGQRSRLRYAVILVVGCSLGAGPWQCNQLLPSDRTLGSGAGPAVGAGSGSAAAGRGSSSGSGSGSAAALLPAPSPPPPLPLPTKPPAAPPIATTPRRDEPSPREPHGPRPPPPSTRVVVADEVVMSTVRRLQPTFVACWKRAQRNDPTLLSARIKLTLDIGADGVVTASRTDAEDAKLSSCLAGVARKLAFPPLGRAAAVEIPLFF